MIKIARTAAIVLGVVLAAGCGPTYQVYNGGIEGQGRQVPEKAAELKPSEAAARFRTDYAPPGRKVTYAGPTNRVGTEVPAQVVPHPFTAVYVSSGVRGVVTVTPAATTTTTNQVRANTGAVEAVSMAGTSATGSVSLPSREALVRRTDAARGDVYVAAKVRTGDRANVQAPEESKAVASKTATGSAQGIGDSDALVSPAAASMPVDATVSVGAGKMEISRASNVASAPSSAKQATDNLVAKANVDSDAPQDVGVAKQPLAASEAVAATSGLTSTAPAAGMESRAVAARTDTAAATLQVETDETVDIGDARFIIAMSKTEGAAAYKRYHAEITILGSKAPGETLSSKAAGMSQTTKGVQEFGSNEPQAGIRQEHANLDVTNTRNALQGTSYMGFVEKTWTITPLGVAAVSPPGVSVLKQARLITAAGIAQLVKKRVLLQKPKSDVVICYRICVLNESDSVAVDVKVMDRLDDKVALLPDSCFTSSGSAKVTFDEGARALEVTLPRLEARGFFIIEFYVEPVAGK